MLDWRQLQDRWYRRIQFPFSKPNLWDHAMNIGSVSGENGVLYAICPNGGPFAFLKDRPSRSSNFGGGGGGGGIISIHSLDGNLLRQIRLERHEKLVGMDWTLTSTAGERLVCVFEDGTVHLFDAVGSSTDRQFSLGPLLQSTETMVFDCRIDISGQFVVLSSDFCFIFVSNIEDPKPRKFPNIGLLSVPNDWGIIPSSQALSRHVEALVCDGQSIVSLGGKDPFRFDSVSRYGPFQMIKLSPDKKMVAMLNNLGVLFVVSADFEQIMLEFPAKNQNLPQKMAWCGSDSVVLYWGDVLLIVGPFGDWLKYSYDSQVLLLTEIDGLRIVGPDQSEFLQRVPDVVEDVYKYGSTAPAALLFNAQENFEQGDPRADDILRSIRPNLLEAVSQLVAAAAYEFSEESQTKILRAASLGKAFLDDYAPDDFMKTCKILRVLGAVRDIGLYISYEQFALHGPAGLLKRLCIRNRHFLAVKICELLHLNANSVITDWANKKIQQSQESDLALSQSIFDRIGQRRGVSFSEIAKIAFNIGRPGLAAKIILHEKHTSEQVPLLLKMQENNLALNKAVESGDADLINMVSLDLKRRLGLPDFFRMMTTHQDAFVIFAKYLKKRDSGALKDFFYQDDKRYESALLLAEISRSKNDVDDAVSNLKAASKLLTGYKEYSFTQKIMDDELNLLETQAKLERDLKLNFVGTTITETIGKLCQLDQMKIAQKIKNEFRISEKRFWHIRIRAFAETQNWEALDKLATKRSPVGFAPFVDACFKNGNVPEARKYIMKAEPISRPELYMKIGAFSDAADAAFQTKNIDILLELRSKNRNQAIAQDLDRKINELRI